MLHRLRRNAQCDRSGRFLPRTPSREKYRNPYRSFLPPVGDWVIGWTRTGIGLPSVSRNNETVKKVDTLTQKSPGSQKSGSTPDCVKLRPCQNLFARES